jgi:hypothetical protein
VSANPEAVSRLFPDSSSGLDARKIVQDLLLLSKRNHAILPVGNLKGGPSMKEKPDVITRFFEVKAEDLP